MVPAGQGNGVYEEGQAQFVHDGVEFDVGVQGADQQSGEQHARRTQAETENADAADQEAEQQHHEDGQGMVLDKNIQHKTSLGRGVPLYALTLHP